MALNPNPLDAATQKHLAVAVKFTWGDPVKVAQYVRFDRRAEYTPGLVPPDGWTAAPELDVETDKQDGGIGDAGARVKILRTRPPFDLLCRPYAHAPVTAELAEVDPYHWNDTYRVIHWGQIVVTTENKFKSRRLVEAAVAGLKSRLGFALGVSCTPSCAHVLGDQGCAVNLAPYTHTGECVGVSGRLFIVWNAPLPPSPTYYQFGEAYCDGLRLMIASNAGTTFKSAFRLPPPEWSGKIIRLTAGCDKRLDGDCRNKFHNEKRHMALGIRMPSYNVQYENP